MRRATFRRVGMAVGIISLDLSAAALDRVREGFMTEQDSDATRAVEHVHARGESQHAYEPPHVTVLGTLADLTEGEPDAQGSDGMFAGSLV